MFGLVQIIMPLHARKPYPKPWLQHTRGSDRERSPKNVSSEKKQSSRHGEEMLWKLDGVGPVDNRPSIGKLHHSVQKQNKNNNKKCDMWHVTHDMWHVTCYGGWTFSQNFSPLALMVCDLWYLEDWEEKADRQKEQPNAEWHKHIVKKDHIIRLWLE